MYHPKPARLLAAVAIATLTATAARADVVIGVVGPMSGTLAVLGEEMRAGATQAVADLNAAGGVNGETVTLEVMDDACDAKTADALANQLAGKGAVMVVGHLCLSASMAAASVYATNKIVQISPSTTYPKFTDERAGPGVFRLAGRDDEQGMVAGTFLADHFADKTIAIVNDDSSYGKDLADLTRRTMNAAGKREALTQSYQAATEDFTDLVARLQASNVDVVFIGGYHADVARIAHALRDRGMTTTIVSGDAVATQEYWSLAGDAGEGTLMTFPPDPRKNAEAAAVVDEFRESGVEPEGFVLDAYAAVRIWAEAATEAGTFDFGAVTAALQAGAFPSVLGPVAFDAKGDSMLPGFVVYQWHDGAYDYFAR